MRFSLIKLGKYDRSSTFRFYNIKKKKQLNYSKMPKLELPPLYTIRHFSNNEEFRKTLNRLKGLHQNENIETKKVETINTDDTLDKIKLDNKITNESSSNNGNNKNTESKSSNSSNETESKTTSDKDDNNTNQNMKSENIKISIDFHQIKDYALSTYDSIIENIKLAYAEMKGETQESNLTRKVTQADTYRRSAEKSKNEEDNEDEDIDKDNINANKEDIQSAIVLVKEPKSAWESMKERLQDSPFIKEILKNSKKFTKTASETDLGKKASEVGQSVKNKIEDVKEFWETSQNPLVYTLSGVWDSVTGETEEGIAISAIRKLDPKFDKYEWSQEVKTNLVPLIIKAHLVGNTNALKPWLGEGVYNKLAADIRIRKHDGIVFDSNILDIEENQMILKFLENGGPVIVVVYMVQQINCIRNRKGEIIEGGESEIRAKFYSMAFQQVYDEDQSTVDWKIVDYEFAGDIPYI